MLEITSLPPLVLGTIFSKLPLRDVIKLGQVCPLWKSYQDDIICKVHSITVLVGHSSPASLIAESCFAPVATESHSNTLEFATLDRVSVKYTLMLLEDVTELQIAISDTVINCFMIDQVMKLLRHWSGTLKTVRLWLKFSEFKKPNPNYRYNFQPKSVPEKLHQLLNTFNFQLNSLEHLTFDLCCHSYCLLPFDLPVLRRLHEFYFNACKFNFGDVYRILMKHAKYSRVLKRFGLGSAAFESIHWNKFKVDCPQLMSKIDCLSISLKHLYPEMLTLAINCIAPMSGLTRLHLDLNLLQTPDAVLFNPSSRILNLPSLKSLILTLQSDSHIYLECLRWDTIFPAVKYIELRHAYYSPNMCPWNNTFSGVTAAQVTKNNNRLLECFKRCHKLERVHSDKPVPVDWELIGTNADLQRLGFGKEFRKLGIQLSVIQCE